MFAAVLHMPLSAEEYSALTLIELDEFRETVREMTRRNR